MKRKIPRNNRIGTQAALRGMMVVMDVVIHSGMMVEDPNDDVQKAMAIARYAVMMVTFTKRKSQGNQPARDDSKQVCMLIMPC